MPQKLVRRAQQLLRKALLAECGASLRIRDGNLAPLRVPMSICCCTASEYARSRAASAFRSRPARSTLMPLIVPDNCPADAVALPVNPLEPHLAGRRRTHSVLSARVCVCVCANTFVRHLAHRHGH